MTPAAAVVLNNIAAAHDGLGDWQQAASIYDEALALREALEDLEGQAKTLRNSRRPVRSAWQPQPGQDLSQPRIGHGPEGEVQALLKEIRKTMSQLPKLRRK